MPRVEQILEDQFLEDQFLEELGISVKLARAMLLLLPMPLLAGTVYALVVQTCGVLALVAAAIPRGRGRAPAANVLVFRSVR